MTHARRPTTYIVGDDDGWDPVVLMDTLARGKTFYVGDSLEFKYDDRRFNLVVVNRTGCETCKRTMERNGIRPMTIRSNFIYGYNYFIGTYNPEDCSTGLKMVIKALAPN